MSFSKGLNASSATGTKNRTPESVSPFSGLCTTCIEGCPGLCEVGKSAFRGRDVLYPEPFGKITAAAQKDYPVDLSHFNISGTAVGADGIKPDSDLATFPSVSTETEIGSNEKIKLKLPIVISGMGSTEIARTYWEALAIGAAISGVILTVGENICGMDPDAVFKNGTIMHSPEMARRIRLFMDWYDGYGTVAIQANVEDTKLKVSEYAIQELGAQAIELKWGQGAKNIGGEVKLSSIDRAKQLKERGYIVIPDPGNPAVINSFNNGNLAEFERHSRIGMVERDTFLQRVEELREAGAKYIFLKTGAYRPADLARAIKFASEAKIDLLTIDGAGGGTGMSPWRMMNEWGIPTVYIEALTYKYAKRLQEKGEFVPDIAIAGGFSLEDQIFKGLSLGSPYIKAVGMARSPLTSAMVGTTVGNMIDNNKVPGKISSQYGTTLQKVFQTCSDLSEQYDGMFESIPPGAIGVYTYFDRLKTGIKQLMCGARKFSLKYITRDDIFALTKEASSVTGINYVMDWDTEEVERILG